MSTTTQVHPSSPAAAEVAAPARTVTPIPTTRLVGVELRKMFDTRAGFWLMASVGIVTLLATAAVILWAPYTAITQNTFSSAIGTPLAVVLPIIAVLAVTSEYSQRTGLTTYTLVPWRGRVLGAKLVATLLVGVVAMFVALAVGGAQLADDDVGAVRDLAHETGVGVGAEAAVHGGGGDRGLVQGTGEPVVVGGAHEGAGRGQQLGLAALGDDRAVADHDDVVGDDLDLVQQVRGQQHGAAVVGEAAEQVAHPADAGRVEAVGGLVEDQHLRVPDEGGREAEALAHAEGVVADPALGLDLGEADPGDGLGDPRLRQAHGPGGDREDLASRPSGVLR